jgi:hypothetical protein
MFLSPTEEKVASYKIRIRIRIPPSRHDISCSGIKSSALAILMNRCLHFDHRKLVLPRDLESKDTQYRYCSYFLVCLFELISSIQVMVIAIAIRS